MRKFFYLLVLIITGKMAFSQEYEKLSAEQLAIKMAETIMYKWPDSLSQQGSVAKWSYDLGVFFEGMANLYNRQHDLQYVMYMQHIMDLYVKPDGSLERYRLNDYNIDYVKNGRTLLFLYKTTKHDKYQSVRPFFT